MPLTPARFRPFALSVNYDRIKNLRPRKNIRTAMNHGAWGLPAVPARTQRNAPCTPPSLLCAEINMFACSQKEQNGLDKAVEVRLKRPFFPRIQRG